jgi:membrane fusion protein (multidrug efflux system)
MVKSNIFIITLCLAFCPLLSFSCSQKEEPKAKQARLATVTVTKPTEERVERVITAIGTLELEDETSIATEVGGLIKEVKFKEGQEINPGDTLVVLDETNFKLNLEKANAAFNKAKANLSLAEDNYTRAKTLREKDLISSQDYQGFVNALENAKADLAGAQTNCQIAQRALDSSVIQAPVIEGGENKHKWEVQKKLVSVGEYLNTGSPVAELVNRTVLKLRFTVPEREAKYLVPAKTVTFSVPAVLGKDFKAVIFYIAPNIAESTRAVIVKAYFDNKDRLLRAGYSANVSFVGETSEKAIMVPRRSLRFDVDKSYVFAVVDGVLRRKDITIGIEKDDFVEIASGISLEDTVVVRSGSFLEEGAKVEAVPDKPAPSETKKDK